MSKNCAVLKDPLQVGRFHLQNRILLQPMEGADGTREGAPGPLTLRRYGRFANSGAAVVWAEAIAVCHEGRANPHQLWLHEGNVEEYKRLVSSIRETARAAHGFAPLIVAQLTHSGRQSRPDGTPRERIAYRNDLFEARKPLSANAALFSDEECDALPEQYYKAVCLAMEAGFDAADIKCCHGYLLCEFLSAYHRAGRYGGCLENRARLFLACFAAAHRAAAGTEFMLTTRLSLYDAFPYPWGFGVHKEENRFCADEPLWLLGQLQARFGVSLVNVTLGNPYVNPHVNRPYPAYQGETVEEGLARIAGATAEAKRAFGGMRFVLSGFSARKENALAYAAGQLEANTADLAGFGRMAFAYPDFWQDYLQNGALTPAKCCIACGKCSEILRAGGPSGCPVRDTETYLPMYQKFVK